jgi:hypothetical protein
MAKAPMCISSTRRDEIEDKPVSGLSVEDELEAGGLGRPCADSIS